MVIVEQVLYYLVLLDALGANVFAWIFPKWQKKLPRWFTKHLPVTKGWSLVYLVLVLWVGYGLYRLGVLW